LRAQLESSALARPRFARSTGFSAIRGALHASPVRLWRHLLGPNGRLKAPSILPRHQSSILVEFSSSTPVAASTSLGHRTGPTVSLIFDLFSLPPYLFLLVFFSLSTASFMSLHHAPSDPNEKGFEKRRAGGCLRLFVRVSAYFHFRPRVSLVGLDRSGWICIFMVGIGRLGMVVLTIDPLSRLPLALASLIAKALCVYSTCGKHE